MLGKHTKEALTIKQLEETIKLKDKEIKDIKTECADNFKKIRDLCFINDYGNSKSKTNRIYEIASDNFNLLLNDLLDYDNEMKTSKIIELPTTCKSNK